MSISGDRNLKEISLLNEVVRARLNPVWLVPLQKRSGKRYTQRKDHMKTQGRRRPYMVKERNSEETNPACTLFVNF